MIKKTLFMGLAALAVSAAFTSCSKGGDEMPEVQAPKTFGDSVATYMGISEGMTSLDALVAGGQKDFNKEQFLAGMKYVLTADTSASFRNGMATAMNYLAQFAQFNDAGVDFNTDMFLANYSAEFNKEKPDTTVLSKFRKDATGVMAALQDKMMTYSYEQQAKMQAQIAKMYNDNVTKGKAFIADKMKADKDIKTTPSGIAYKIEKQGTGAVAKSGDSVKMIYDGKHIDGSVFDSTQNQVVEASTDKFIPGFAEALTTFPAGTRVTLYIPQELAYGQQGMPQGGIMPGETLEFDLEIVE